MKVLVVHNAYQTRFVGGEDIVVRQEVAALQKQLGKASVFTYQVSNTKARFLPLMWEIWGSRRHFRAIQNCVHHHQIAIVHVHNFFPLLTPSVFQAAKRAGAVVIHTLHNYRWWCLKGDLFQEGKGHCEQCVSKRWAWPGVRYRCYRRSWIQSLVASLAFAWYRLKQYPLAIDAYFALNAQQQEWLQALRLPTKVLLKPNAIRRPKRMVPADKRADCVFVGRLEEAKGIYLLLKAWQSLPFRLHVIGEGPLSRELKQAYSQKNILFHGKLPHHAALRAMARAKYVLCPSLAVETFGLTVAEALSWGTPVIGCEIGTRLEWIIHEESGLLYPPTAAALRKGIQYAMTHPAYERLVKGARARSALFDAEHLTQTQLALYRQCLKEKEEAR